MSQTIDRLYTRIHHVLMRPGRSQTRLDRLFIRCWTALDVAAYKRLGFSATARMMGVDVLLLRTVGRRTGKRREVLVACTNHGGRLVVGGGNWGWDRDPGWVHNAIDQPDVEVVRRRRVQPMRAVVLSGQEAQAANDALGAAYPHSLAYVARRSRPIPVLRLDPIADASEIVATSASEKKRFEQVD
ncbi:MAG TPA: nitroreductase/quinone reductase family protein [Acidimicrobiales bacterium]|nr:nitroreductase/quinone reductase family protein [Acidimicrobiales bacterium]